MASKLLSRSDSPTPKTPLCRPHPLLNPPHTRNYVAHNLIHDEVPGLPERVREDARRQGGIRHRSAAQGLHHPHCQHEIAEHGVHEHVLAEGALEVFDAQHVPGDGLRDGRQHPVQLTHGGFAVVVFSSREVHQIFVAAVGSRADERVLACVLRGRRCPSNDLISIACHCGVTLCTCVVRVSCCCGPDYCEGWCACVVAHEGEVL